MSRVVALCIMILCCGMVSAQRTTLLSREQLDSLVDPQPSRHVQSAIVAEPTTIDLAEVSDEDVVDVYFTLRNATTHRIDLTDIRLSCRCLQVITPIDYIAAGQSQRLGIRFNPAGRNGSFSLPIHIYTPLDELSPTLRLTLDGRVVVSNRWTHLPISMGTLRLSRKEVMLDNIAVGSMRSEHIVVANVGSEAITLSGSSTVEGLQFSAEPATLSPGQEGEIVISYLPQQLPPFDIETIIILEGELTTRPTERMIRITIQR